MATRFVTMGTNFVAEVLDLVKPEYVEAWLDKFQPTDIVGYADWAGRCPFANFLSERLGKKVFGDYDTFSVVVSEGDTTDDMVELKCPLWLNRFTRLVDGGPPDRAITRSHARRLLRQSVKDAAEGFVWWS